MLHTCQWTEFAKLYRIGQNESKFARAGHEVRIVYLALPRRQLTSLGEPANVQQYFLT